MFTGLIEEMGEVAGVKSAGRSLHLTVRAQQVMAGMALGDSVAVNGVCLTVVRFDQRQFTADVMPETYEKTTLRHQGPGAVVNLERCLKLGGRLGGHLVQGHVDGVGQVAELHRDEIAIWVTIAAPPAVMRYVVPKGSVAIDGISLTVADRSADRFRVGIIPHTAAATTMGRRQVGDPVNLEADVIGKYVEQFVADRLGAGTGQGVTRELLERAGFDPGL